MSYGYGDFGNLGKNYADARQEFPNDALDWLWTFIKAKNPKILDLGCGTGIATRQLKTCGAQVIGCDRDPLMIEEAKKTNDAIKYFDSPAENLPFSDHEFDAVTAFSAFHWFANQEAVSEIKRVLRSGGYFYVINKNDAGDFKKGYYKIVKDMICHDLPQAKRDYKPAEILANYGFLNIQEKESPYSEYFTKEKAMAYLQSVSIWNLVPEKLKSDALTMLDRYCEERIVNGKIERKLNLKAVVGRLI